MKRISLESAILTVLFLLAFLSMLAALAHAQPYPTRIDGRTLPPDKQFPRTNVVRYFSQPYAPPNTTVIQVRGLWIHDVRDMKALDIVGEWDVLVEDVKIERIYRTEAGRKWVNPASRVEAIHIDYIRMSGARGKPVKGQNITVRRVILDGGNPPAGAENALFGLIKDMNIDTLIFEDVTMLNATTDFQVGLNQNCFIRKVIIRNCSGRWLFQDFGGNTSKGCDIEVENSPNARVHLVNWKGKVVEKRATTQPVEPPPVAATLPVPPDIDASDSLSRIEARMDALAAQSREESKRLDAVILKLDTLIQQIDKINSKRRYELVPVDE